MKLGSLVLALSAARLTLSAPLADRKQETKRAKVFQCSWHPRLACWLTGNWQWPRVRFERVRCWIRKPEPSRSRGQHACTLCIILISQEAYSFAGKGLYMAWSQHHWHIDQQGDEHLSCPLYDGEIGSQLNDRLSGSELPGRSHSGAFQFHHVWSCLRCADI